MVVLLLHVILHILSQVLVIQYLVAFIEKNSSFLLDIRVVRQLYHVLYRQLLTITAPVISDESNNGWSIHDTETREYLDRTLNHHDR